MERGKNSRKSNFRFVEHHIPKSAVNTDIKEEIWGPKMVVEFIAKNSNLCGVHNTWK